MKMARAWVWLWLAAGAAASPAREAGFEGPRPVNAAAVERAARQPAVSLDSLERMLQTEGYMDAAVSQEEGRVRVRAGDRARLRVATVISGADTTALRLEAWFREAEVTRLIDSLLDRQRECGYYYASITISGIERSGDDIMLYMSLVPGPVMRLGEVHYLGLRRTKPATAVRYLTANAGDSLTDRYLVRLEREAAEIPWLRFLPPATVRPLPGFTSADVELQFVEERPLRLDVGGGYIPDTSEATVVWHVDARLNNLFGGGRRARVLSERRDKDRRLLQVSYLQPLFFAGRAEGRIEAATRDYRTLFYEFALRAGYAVRLAQGVTAGVDLEYRGVEPAEGGRSYDAYAAGFSARWDRVDEPLNPANGFEARTTISYGHRKYARGAAGEGERTQYGETRTVFEARVYRRIAGPLAACAGLGYRGFETSEDFPPPAELNLIGGPGTLRGYRNEQFAALRAVLATIEPRIRFGAGYAFGFYDGAFLSNRVSAAGGGRTEESYRSGFGGGVALTDGVRAVTVALGWNPEVPFREPRLSIEVRSGF